MHRLIAAIFACLLAAVPALADKPAKPETVAVKTGTAKREFILYAPAATGPRPVVLVFHGGGGSAGLMANKSADLTRTLTEAGYAVAYMNGSAKRRTKNLRTWNAVHCCAYAADAGINDAVFADAAIEELDARLDIDRTRIFLVGHSNGAMLSYRIAGQMGNFPRAIAAISGAIFADQPDVPFSTSIFMYNAVDDDRVPYQGDPPGAPGFQRTSPALGFVAAEEKLARLKDCGPQAPSSLPGSVTVTERACPGGSALMAVTGLSGGHEWPARPPGYDIEDAILAFFERQR